MILSIDWSNFSFQLALLLFLLRKLMELKVLMTEQKAYGYYCPSPGLAVMSIDLELENCWYIFPIILQECSRSSSIDDDTISELLAMVIHRFFPKMPTSPILPNIVSFGQLLELVCFPLKKSMFILLIAQFCNHWYINFAMVWLG